ncbi:prepilin-type N-terminal cleavage/methylation domain-containing protein [Candidatus Woesebacteria bacterium]|nr:prepilin-type N-terminal cleavage/methylation domain-containing protein [Candidatus Woesebacteria bacterium]
MKDSFDKGYTLIELMIVMAVVAVLSGISIFAMQGARASARDGQRKGDLEAIRSALELYKSDCGFYPQASGNDFEDTFGSSFTNTDGTDFNGDSCPAGGTRTYLNDVPADPQTTNDYRYNSTSNFTYELCTVLEEPPTTTQSCSGSYGNYRVTNP